MKLASVPGITVSLVCNNATLQEHDDDSLESHSGTSATRYVEAIPSAEYSIVITLETNGPKAPKPCDASSIRVFIDGKYMTGRVCLLGKRMDVCIKGIDVGTIKGSWGLAYSLLPFQFAELKTETSTSTGRAKLTPDEAKKLGEITVNCTWTQRDGAVMARTEKVPQIVTDGGVAEKCLKGRAMSCTTKLGMRQPSTPLNTQPCIYPFGKAPFASYTFRYRSKHDLQIEGIIPRDPIPVPLEERDPSTLTPDESLLLIRQLQDKIQVDARVKRERANDELAVQTDTKRRRAIPAEMETVDLTAD